MTTLITYTTLLLKLVVLVLVKVLHAVPPDYCLRNLNKSDCSVSPIHVFSYYKPGSRCELEVWRGCPTDNLFRTESACINTCIRRKKWIYEKGVTKFVSEKKLNEEKCHGPVNINKCNSNNTRAFVYNKTTNECDEIIWTGCQHKGNVFEEQLDCLQTCYRGDLNWNDKINIVPNNLANELDTILDNISLDDENENIKLLLHQTVSNKDDDFTLKVIEEKFVKTTPTTKKHAENDSYSNVTKSKKIAEYRTTKVLDKTTASLNYSSTAKYLVTTNKTEYTKITTPQYTPKTTAQTTEVKSTTSEVLTTKTESASPETTTATKITTTTDGTITQATTPEATRTEATTTEATTTEATTPKATTTEATTTEATTTEATTTEATTPKATTTEATTLETTTTETTTIITTVEETTTVKTTTVDTGTAKEVVLPQDMY